MLGSVILGKAETILQDAANVHWSAPSLLGWLNSAQRVVVLVRPDAKTTRALITLVDGPHQGLPTGGLRLIRIVRNENGRAVTLVSEEQLTDFDRSWYTASESETTKHYLFDPLEPKAFDVYPPAIAGNKLLGVWSSLPVDLAEDSDAIDLDDIFEVPLVHLVCYFAYLQDAEDAANFALAEKHLSFAMLALTGTTQADDQINPATSQPARVRPKVR